MLNRLTSEQIISLHGVSSASADMPVAMNFINSIASSRYLIVYIGSGFNLNVYERGKGAGLASQSAWNMDWEVW